MNEHWALSNCNSTNFGKNKYKICISFNYNYTKHYLCNLCLLLNPLTNYKIIHEFEWIPLLSSYVWNGFCLFRVYALSTVLCLSNKQNWAVSVAFFVFHFFFVHLNIWKCVTLTLRILESKICFHLLCFGGFSLFSSTVLCDKWATAVQWIICYV